MNQMRLRVLLSLLGWRVSIWLPAVLTQRIIKRIAVLISEDNEASVNLIFENIRQTSSVRLKSELLLILSAMPVDRLRSNKLLLTHFLMFDYPNADALNANITAFRTAFVKMFSCYSLDRSICSSNFKLLIDELHKHKGS